MMDSKIKIELKPYNALSILSFLREFINDDLSDDYKFTSIKEAVDEYEQQISNNVTDDQLEEVYRENTINQMIGKSPKRN